MKSIRNFWLGLAMFVAVMPAFLSAALPAKNNLLGKFFVTSVRGDVKCVSDGRVLSPAKGDTFLARGATIETGTGAKAVLLFSNQTSVILDESSRLEVDQFEQEFFPPNNNLRVEPSRSSSEFHLHEGRVLISTPALRSGTVMAYRTAHAVVSIRGDKVVIETNEKQTRVLVVSGAVTVDSRSTGGPSVVVGKRLITGEEAILTNGGSSAEYTGLAVNRIPPPKRKTTKELRAAVLVANEKNSAESSVQLAKKLITHSAETPGLSLAAQPPSAIAAAITSLISAQPDAAVRIASSAAEAAPNQVVIIAAAAAKAAPSQAAHIAFAVIAALSQNPAGLHDAAFRLRNAAAVAAAVTTSAPDQAELIAASALQALLQPASADSLLVNCESAATIAAAVARVAPSSRSAAIVTAIFQVLKPTLGSASPQSVSQSIALLGTAVVSAVPAESEKIATALVRALLEAYPNSGNVSEALGLLAAALSQAAPAQTSTINFAIAAASNQSVTSVQGSAARSTALASQISQQLAAVTRAAEFAANDAATAIAELLGGSPAAQPSASELAADEVGASEASVLPTESEAAVSDGFLVSQFDPANFASLAADLDAAQAAQTSVQFNTEAEDDGTFTVRPIPTTPPSLPVELVTSPANGG